VIKGNSRAIVSRAPKEKGSVKSLHGKESVKCLETQILLFFDSRQVKIQTGKDTMSLSKYDWLKR
jgi:hypothetical protein